MRHFSEMGYTDCKDSLSVPIRISLLGMARQFCLDLAFDKAFDGKRYSLTSTSKSYTWHDVNNGAKVQVEITVDTNAQNNTCIWFDFNTAGLPCCFLLICVKADRREDDTWEYYHMGAEPESAIIQGIYGRLVKHIDEVDYKDLDYV